MRNTQLRLTIGLTLLLLTRALPASSQSYAVEILDPLTNASAASQVNGLFGTAIAPTASGNRVAVGAPGTETMFTFDNSGFGFSETQSISNVGDESAATTFGNQVIGGYGTAALDKGVFEIGIDGNVSEFLFGGLDDPPKSLAFAPGVIAAGMPAFANAGRVRVHRYNSEFSDWISDSPIGGGANFDEFGHVIALDPSGTFLYVGAPEAGLNGEVEVYVFNGGSWTPYQTITPPTDFNSQSGARFGHSLAILGDWLVIGAPDADRIFSGVGIPAIDGGIVSIYEFETLSYSYVGRFQGNLDDGNLGKGVALHQTPTGPQIVAGAPGEGTSRSGRAHLYDLVSTTWQTSGLLVPPSPENGEEFGTTVAVAGQRIFIGSPEWDACPTAICLSDIGRVHVFSDGFESGNVTAWQ